MGKSEERFEKKSRRFDRVLDVSFIETNGAKGYSWEWCL